MKEPGTATFTETDWNEESIREVSEKGVDAWRMHWYRASKTLAERAAWQYMEDEKPSWVHLQGFEHIMNTNQLRPRHHMSSIRTRSYHPRGYDTRIVKYLWVDRTQKSSWLTPRFAAVANWYSYLTGKKTDDEAVAPAVFSATQLVSPSKHVLMMLRFFALGTFNMQVLLDYVHAEHDVVDVFPETTKGVRGAEVSAQNWFNCTRSQKILDLKTTPERRTA